VDNGRSCFASLLLGKTSASADAVTKDALPARLIDEFVELARGLLANVALGSIAAVRDETHRVLARFHAGLDAPFLTHRLLLVTPDDAEGYVVDLWELSYSLFSSRVRLGGPAPDSIQLKEF
jgi:hypothetical protein